MNRLKLIIKREYLSKITNRTFVIMTILSPLIFVGVITLIAYLTTVSMEEKKRIALMDDSGVFEGVFKDDAFVSYLDLSGMSLQAAKDSTEKAACDGLLHISKEYEKDVEFISRESPDLSLIDKLEQKIDDKIKMLRLKELGVDLKTYHAISAKTNIRVSNFAGKETPKEIIMTGTALGMAFAYLVFMFILIYGALVMRSVLEEKTNRIIEVILSSVKPFYLMTGKIVGTFLVGITQFFIWVVIGFVLVMVLSLLVEGNLSFLTESMSQAHPEQLTALGKATESPIGLYLREFFDLPLYSLILSFVIYFMGGFLLYGSIYAAIGAAVDSETDSQQFLLPVTLVLIVAIFSGATVLQNPHGTIAVLFSMIPFTSPVVMLMRIPFGVPWWQTALSVLLLFITFLFIVSLASRIYKTGILMYGKKPSYRELLRWLRYDATTGVTANDTNRRKRTK